MGNLLYVIGAFAFLLIVFHIIMKVSGKQTLFWKKVDYFWLGIAGLTLISATAEVRKMIARNEASNLEIKFHSDLDFLKNQAKFYEDYCQIWHKNNWSISDSERIYAAQFDSVKIWFDTVIKRLNVPEESLGWLALDTSSSVFSMTDEIMIKDIRKRFIRMINDVQTSYIEYQETLNKTKSSDFEVVLVAFLPYIFAFALALRITRVSADIFGYM